MWHFATDAMFKLRDLWICVIDKLRCANDGAGSSHGRLIARWRHGRCFYSTRGPTGSLLVFYYVRSLPQRKRHYWKLDTKSLTMYQRENDSRYFKVG